ncbi:MAG: hypothetical protein NT051_03035 [Candidatus Micrarchaeota archaeon]|nr:hypothetical protein [Candidatus Micrarchaeota archaeon]
MKKIGFPKTSMPEETRIALIPRDVRKVRTPSMLLFEKGYAAHLGFSDEDYRRAGATIVDRRELPGAEILCIPKRWKNDSELFSRNQTLMGWLYVSQSPWLQREISEKSMTAIAFEKMYFEDGRYVFQRNREITGMLGMMQALPYAGKPPSKLRNVAILGNGNVAKSVFKILRRFNVKYEIFTSKTCEQFFARLPSWEMIVSCVKYDFTTGPFFRNEHVKDMKPGCLVVDLSADGIEFSKPQKVLAPVYQHKQILVYNNAHIPSLWGGLASEKISKSLLPFINGIISGAPSTVITNAIVAKDGQIGCGCGT